MSTNVTFAGTDIQTNYIKIRDIVHESMDHRELQFERLGTRDGAKLVDDLFAPRVIRLSGTIISSDGTEPTMETEIDEFKRGLNQKEKNLDITYINGTRRYKSSCTRLSITREFYHITHAKWEAEFVVSDPPFGFGLDTLTIEFDPVNFTIGTWLANATFQGTYRPMPIIQITVNSETNLEQIAFTNSETGHQIKVAPGSGYAASDVLIINTSDYTVTLNGAAQDYSGILPEFVQGGNDFTMSFISDNHNVSLKFIY